MSENVIKHVKPKPGYLVCDGLFKIEKFDELNWIVKVKSTNKKATEPVVKVNHARKVTYIREPDGYDRYGSFYFPKVESAVEYIIDRVIPLEYPNYFSDEDINDIHDLLNQMVTLRTQIREEVRACLTESTSSEE